MNLLALIPEACRVEKQKENELHNVNVATALSVNMIVVLLKTVEALLI